MPRDGVADCRRQALYRIRRIYRVPQAPKNGIQNAEQISPRTLTPLLGSRGGGGGGVPICRCKIIGYRPRADAGAKLPQQTRRRNEHSIEKPRALKRAREGEGAKISPKGEILLLPSSRQGRRLLEA